MTLSFRNRGTAACMSMDLEIQIPGFRDLDFNLFGAAVQGTNEAYIDQSEETAGPYGFQMQGVVRIRAASLRLPPGSSGGAIFSGLPSQLKRGDSPIALVTAITTYASDSSMNSGGVQLFVFAPKTLCGAIPRHSPPSRPHSPGPTGTASPSNKLARDVISDMLCRHTCPCKVT